MSNKTGGPAFPIEINSEMTCLGMTLRDYFASCMINSGHTFGPKRSLDPDEVAKQAYELADAMLKAREND
jgi:hypothetical protein